MNAAEHAKQPLTLLPRIGSVWTRDGKAFRTVGRAARSEETK